MICNLLEIIRVFEQWMRSTAFDKKSDKLKNAGQSQSQATVIMPFKYTDEKENFLYAWRAFSYGKKIEIFC